MCTFFDIDSETQVTQVGLNQSFCFCSVIMLSLSLTSWPACSVSLRNVRPLLLEHMWENCELSPWYLLPIFTDGLWFRLWELGVRGRMWRVIKKMYDITESAVLLEGENPNHLI